MSTLVPEVVGLFVDDFKFSADAVTSSARLDEDLGLDSLQWVELRAWLAEQGLSESQLLALDLDTVGDVARAVSESPSRSVGVDPAAGRLDVPRPAALGNDVFAFAVVTPQSVPFLYELATSSAVGFRWRYRGAVPSPEAFQAALWQGVFAQFVVSNRSTVEPVGLVQLYNADQGRGIAYLGAVFVEQLLHTGLPIEAVDLFVRYVFRVWNFRKLYLELPEYNYELIASGAGKRFDVEGRLREYYFYDGRYWDEYILAINREHVEGVKS